MTKNILEFLEEQVERVPEKMAYADELDTLSFIDVYNDAKAIGSGLGKLIPEKTPVAVLMDSRHIQYVEAMFGILYAGCFYAPMDSAVPLERLDILLERLEPSMILYDDKNQQTAFKFEGRYPLVSFSALKKEAVDEELLAGIRKRTSFNDLLCVMFTSGSTGIPKWVAHTHASIYNWCLATIDAFGFEKDLVVGNQSPFFYSNSLGSVFLPISLGCSACILSASILSFPKKMIEALKKFRVSDLCMTPSSYTSVADAGALESEVLPDLKWMILSGEACNSQAMKKWTASTPNGYVWNFYGSTEALPVAVLKLERTFKPGEIIPVGPVYDQMHIIFVDEDGNEVPYGEKGEMLVHSPWMSSGYYKDPERTKEAFVNDPLNKGWNEIFYRTGDLGFFNELGELVVTGRKDNMIKHKGYRMELGEVEYAIKSIEGVNDGCCVHDKDTDTLYCFYMGRISEQDTARALKGILPKFAIPDRIIKVDSIPYTATVKADRKALLKMAKEGMLVK